MALTLLGYRVSTSLKEPTMKRVALLLAPLVAMLVSTSAQAQCPNGALVCADIQVSGSVSVGARRSVQVVHTPPPPRGRVVVVQQAPPAPPPQQVVVQYAPPPPPPSEVIITVEQEQQAPRLRLVRPVMSQKFALTGRLSAMIGDRVRMGGFSAGLRLRPSRVFGVELSVGGFGGTDYNGMDRVEVPFKFDAMIFLPRASRVQMYLLAGIGSSWARAEGYHEGYREFLTREYVYLGGEAGVGLEWRVATRFALSADVRGFIRTRVDDGNEPEFIRGTGSGTQSTDTSAGALLSLGMHLYF